MMFSPDDFAHLRIPLKDIRSFTNNFSPIYLLGEHLYATKYFGHQWQCGELIHFSTRRFKTEHEDRNELFWTEVYMLSSLKHKNLVSIFGFCDEDDEKVIIYNYTRLPRANLSDYRLSNFRLSNYLSDPISLTWVRRSEICVALANLLSYIYYDEPRDFSVIHRNINSYTVWISNDWKPMLTDWELSLKIKASERHHSFHTPTISSVWDREGYVDPTCLETNTVNHKSDIYSFGIMDPQSINVFAKTAYDCLNEERSERLNINEIVIRLEGALKLQMDHGSFTSISTHVKPHVSQKTKSSLKDLSHLKLSFKDIESATNYFALENFVEKFKDGTIYKGRLLHSEQFIDIIVKKFYLGYVKDESKRFWTEVSLLSSLKHKNLVSLIGFYDDMYSNIIVYKEANRSLSGHLGDQTLTWMQRLKICVSVANAVSYIHYDPGQDFSVIHCNITSSNILLDDKWEPKLSSLEFSLKNTVAWRQHLLLTRDIVENVYLDPKYKKTGGVTHKSDVYSFGVVLLEVLCGRCAGKDEDEDELGEGLLSQLEKSHLDDMVDPHLRKQMDPESFRIFSDTTYYCLQEERAKRPYIDQVVKRLDKALELQWKHENPELPKNAADSTSSNHLKWKNLEHLKIGLSDIVLATENFADTYCIGEGGYGMVYKAELKHFDSSKSSSIDGENKCDLPKKRSTVAIKRIFNTQGEQGFISEIEMLTTCKHDNIISLLGFCEEGRDHMILVYELASKGSLEDYLGNTVKMTTLTWMQRLKICVDIAHGLNYIHTNTDQDKQKIIHRDIKSANILLGDNWEAKIANFGLSKFHPANQEASTINTNMIAGTNTYLDPEYQKYGRLNKKSDIYSFGVVLLEILTGSLAYDLVYTKVNEKGITPIAIDHFKKGTLMEIVDHKIKEETDERVFSLSKGPDKESLDIFSEIAFRCVAETQGQRPTIEVVINELKKALHCQENHKDNLKLSLEDIKLATQSFSQDNIIGHGDFGNVYKGHTHGHNIIASKRLDRKSAEGEVEFMTELNILMEYKHENVIGLLGYSDEEDEKIIVYEYASRGSLDRYLSDDCLTWVMRLKICIDIAIGLEFLHGTVSSPEMVIHRDISSSNILLFDDWKAKISDFGLSLVCPTNQDVGFVIDNATGTIGYRDPLYLKTDFLTKESDIFSLGAVLFDILCGKLSSEELDDEYLYLPFLAKYQYHVGKLDKLVFEGIKEQIVPESYITFTRIALQCLHHRREKRPTADEVVIQLKKALEFQEDYEKWEPKLPKDYKEVVKMSKCPEIYSTIKKEDLYNIFSKGILLQQDKVLSFDGDGERNEMVSATMFSYNNSCRREWKSLPESRILAKTCTFLAPQKDRKFGTVVKMLDISNLNIEIKTNTQLLSANVVYGVYLVFKFCESRNFGCKPMHVDLNYRKGNENLNAYFATWRDKWMTIELYRFLNQNEDFVFEFLLECFSSYHCGDGAIYVEGIEFRAIEKEKHEEIGKLKEVRQVLKSNFDPDQVQQLPTNFEEIFKIPKNYDELFWLGEVNGKELLMLSAKAAIYKYSNVNLFTSKPSAESRFQEVIEVLPQKVFYINCTIKSQMLSPDTEYMCYLVFKLSEECQGLHYPVKVRDLLHQENNEADFFYFITPSLLNVHDFTRVPKQREDGWMEIQVWKFNSTHEFKHDSLSIDMKFTSHEGPMSGLIVCGLEFRPM
ncbi:protein kinase-like domain, Phloem protein 2-like protein [Artemisia annua]|uniref:non-specific serine/threonine protein kinase n=1 Tax=Artemisia annua TaxID=35608 RepID=A0A2U1PFA6_ARTAN|nr:protein kinase-like domain, Phloem protein 2-like protein [Artemisia annua]